ncbi:mRNA export factor GLE1-like isoform X1 [Cydia splendana]|uniref:mRNA export factor GLE1-like isoform X1 n=1 Tax=Cydia splendana TaxID=1100963 RepID=UPI00300D9241
MSKLKPENKEEYLAKKREQAKLWYQNIKNNPELYAEYQRKNRQKYEKRLARKKVVPISGMTSIQQRQQRKKWREESKRRYQRKKGKKERDKQSGAENSSPEDDSHPVNLIETILLPNPEITEEDFTIKTHCQDLINQDIEDNPEFNLDYQSRHENNTMHEHIPTIEMTSCQQKNQTEKIEGRKGRLEPDKDKIENLKPENTAEVLTIKMVSEGLSYQSINDNPDLNLSDIGNHERKKAQDKNVPSIEITSHQHQIQRETLRDEGEFNSEEVFFIKTESKGLNYSINNNTELNMDYQAQYERNKEQEKITPIIEMPFSQQKMQRQNLREEGKKRCQPKKDKKEKRKLLTREEILAKKRERERLRYHYIKNNPELYSEYQRKQNTNYENRKAQKKILPINEMTPRQQKQQRKRASGEQNQREDINE